jgi:recombination associated protein RdgC
MWFKNLIIYRFSQPVPFTLDELEVALEQKPARHCASQETHTLGWGHPFGRHSEQRMHTAAGYTLIAMTKTERILPASVVQEALREKVEEIEARDGRKVYKKERETLKDEIVAQLLPRAFIRTNTTRACLCLAEGWIAVDASSTTRAEDLLSLLRECTGSLPVRPIGVNTSPFLCLTHWVKTGIAPEGLAVGDGCDLFDTGEDGGMVRCQHQDLSSDEIQQHLEAGKQVGKLDLHWQGKLTFSLDERLGIKRLRFADMLHDEAIDQGGDSAIDELDASLVIMGGTLRELIPAICAAFGGEVIPEGV